MNSYVPFKKPEKIRMVFELFSTVAGVKKHPHLEVNGLFCLDFREVNPFYPVPLHLEYIKNTKSHPGAFDSRKMRVEQS